MSLSKTDPRGGKRKRPGAGRPQGAPKGTPKGGPSKGGKPVRGKVAAGTRTKKESPYFLRPVTGGIGVFRRPVGNRAEATNCGVMPSRKHADLLAAQLKRAESVVSDLFLEATDDGIEALEAVLAACRLAVLKQVQRSSGAMPAQRDDDGDGRRPRRGRRRGRSGPRRGEAGSDAEPGGAADAGNDAA